MPCSGRATAAVHSHDPELLCTKLQVLHVRFRSVRSYCFPLLHTFQYLSGFYLSESLLTNNFYILLIFAHNQSQCLQVNHSAFLSPFFIFISQGRTSSDPDITSWVQLVLCAWVHRNLMHTVCETRNSPSGNKTSARHSPRCYWSNLEMWITQENVGHGIWKQKTKDKRNPGIYQYHTQNYSCLSLDG